MGRNLFKQYGCFKYKWRTQLNAFVFDQYQNGYYKIGEKVGKAWDNGEKFMKK